MKHHTGTENKNWLYADDELLRLWNESTDRAATLTNTRLLMQLAARPFFDFFFQDANVIVLADTAGDTGKVKDIPYLNLIESKNILSLHDYQGILRTAVAADLPTILLASGGILPGRELIKNCTVITVNDPDLFGNVEGVWKAIRQELNPRKFKQVFVAMGRERSWIVPRVSAVYHVPVYDISYAWHPPQPSRLLRFAKKIAKKILRPGK